MLAPITPHDFFEIRWRGHWIWAPEEPIEPGGFLPSGATTPSKESHDLFRKTIDLDDVPKRAPARVTADSRYVLFVDGQEVVRSSIPTPHGLISVEANSDAVMVDSPVPVVVDLDGRPPRALPSGRHELPVR